MHQRQRGEASLAVRRQLVTTLVRVIRDRGLNQVQAARWLAVDQSRISNLLNNKPNRFSTDTLIDMTARAGITVGINFATLDAQMPGNHAPTEIKHLNIA